MQAKEPKGGAAIYCQNSMQNSLALREKPGTILDQEVPKRQQNFDGDDTGKYQQPHPSPNQPGEAGKQYSIENGPDRMNTKLKRCARPLRKCRAQLVMIDSIECAHDALSDEQVKDKGQGLH
jgi:hypothetical protein